MRRLLTFFCVTVALFVCPPVLQARSLYWQDMEVQARLDEHGVLHISEMQTIVFNGGWNGGERRFAVRPGQKLHLSGVFRLGADGRKIPLVHGNLALVDHYTWAGTNLLRWRSRLPSDPPFQNTPLSYVLEYSLSGVLKKQGDNYLLSHDFCFADRPGPIKRFSLELAVDPVWQGITPVPHHHGQRDIPPGQGVVLTTELQYTGSDSGRIQVYHPAAKAMGASGGTDSPSLGTTPFWLRFLLLCGVWLFVLVRVIRFFGYEIQLNRFKALPSVDTINRSWLEKHLFSLLPEEVGATWDTVTDSAEVTAVLARLVVEGKLESHVEQKIYHFMGINIPGLRGSAVLHLKLLVPRSSFRGYERHLIEELFVAGDETSSKIIRDYYRSTTHFGETFNPVEKIREPLRKQVERLTGESGKKQPWRWVPSTLLATAGFFMFFVNSFFHLYEFPAAPIMLGIMIVLYIFTLVVAVDYRKNVTALVGRLLLFIIFLLLLVSVYSFYLLRPDFGSPLLLLSLFCFVLAGINNVINLAKTQDSAEGVLLRQRLGAARNYFKKELKKKKPDIEDDWFPYLLAFGLGRAVDSWFIRFRLVQRHRWFGGVTSSSGTSAMTGTTGFSGGGGLFGGGGMSGSWTTAAGAISGNASGGSGGFGGGGGGSGGGGGGGW